MNRSFPLAGFAQLRSIYSRGIGYRHAKVLGCCPPVEEQSWRTRMRRGVFDACDTTVK